MIHRYLCCFLIIVFVASSSQGADIIGQFPKHPTRKVYPPKPRPEPGIDVDELGIQTTGCLGTCPVFTFIVFKDGTFRYQGERYVKKKGMYIGTVDTSQLSLCLEYAASLDWKSYTDEYTIGMSDGPGTYLLLRGTKGTKIIYDYAGMAPLKIRVLEGMIENLMKDAKFKRTK